MDFETWMQMAHAYVSLNSSRSIEYGDLADIWDWNICYEDGLTFSEAAQEFIEEFGYE